MKYPITPQMAYEKQPDLGLIIISFLFMITLIAVMALPMIEHQKNALSKLTTSCDERYGKDNYTISNGHSCTDKEGFPDMFIGMHNCIDCEEIR